MTAITSLESVHKKGIFGDHQKKVTKELLQISEVKRLTIIQVVQYKKSNIELSYRSSDNYQIKSECGCMVLLRYYNLYFSHATVQLTHIRYFWVLFPIP